MPKASPESRRRFNRRRLVACHAPLLAFDCKPTKIPAFVARFFDHPPRRACVLWKDNQLLVPQFPN